MKTDETIKFNQSYPIVNHRYTQLSPKNTRSSEERPRKASKPQIWGKKNRFDTIVRIILKVRKK